MNQYYRLTTEEPPSFFDAQPPHASYTSGHAIWMPVASAFYPMPTSSTPNHLYCLQRQELLRMGDDAAVYDYMCAVKGDITTSLPSNIQHLPDDLYKLTQTGAAHTDTRPTEADIGGLTQESLAEMEDYIIMLEEDEDAYEFAVLLDGDMENEDRVEYALDGTIQITAGGNVTSTVDGVVRALPYREGECGMPLDCLAALERYFNSLGFQEMAYEYRVQYAATHNVFWLGEDDNDYTSESEEEEEEDYAHAVPRVAIDIEEFVAKLEFIDVSAVSADDMKCFYCWDSFKQTGEHMVTLSTGEVMAGHTPVKMPCPHGHLIGKMCLMELIDVGLDQCPVCRANIVTLVD